MGSMTAAKRQARFDGYRDLWDRLCAIGSGMTTAYEQQRHDDRAALESEYAATLSEIRRRQEQA